MKVIMKLDEAKRIVTPHLADNEVPQHISLGYLRRPWKPLVAWGPVWILVLFQVLGKTTTGVLGWVLMLVLALLVNATLIRRYLIVTTNERFLLIAVGRLRKYEKKHSSLPLAQVGVEGLKEGKSAVQFNLRVSPRRLKLDFEDSYLENSKSNAAAIYQALLKGRGGTLSAPGWLRKGQFLDGMVIILAVLIPLVMVGMSSRTEFQQRITGLLRGKLSVRVTNDYTPSIVVLTCQAQREQAKIAGNTYLCMVSSKGEPIGQGKTWIYGSADAEFRSDFFESSNLLRVFVDEPAGLWIFEFEPPEGQDWIVGLYQNAERCAFHDATRPGLDVSGHGTGCSTLSGRFEILELEYDRSVDRVMRFAANFEQRCYGGPPLLGAIRFNSTLGR